MQLYEQTPEGTAEVPRPCPDGHEETTPAWGACTVAGCWEMGRQWRCQRPGCGKTTQHEHKHQSA